METITAKVEVKLPTGSKEIEMAFKGRNDIEDCEDGTIVMLTLINGDELTGFYNGMSGDDVLLQALDKSVTLGYKHHWIASYLEEIKK